MEMYIGLFLVAFIATTFRSTFGFGEAMIAVPLLSIFLPIQVAVPLTVLMSIAASATIVIQDYKEIDFCSVKWLILFAAMGIPLGLYILSHCSEFYVKIGLGVFIIAYSVYTLLAKHTFTLAKDNKRWLFICGFMSGVFGGAYGLNRPPLIVYGNMRKWNAQYFRATLQAYSLPACILALLGYLYKGTVTPSVLEYFVLSLIVVLPATFLGRHLNSKLNDASFHKYAYGGLVLIGVILLISTVV